MSKNILRTVAFAIERRGVAGLIYSAEAWNYDTRELIGKWEREMGDMKAYSELKIKQYLLGEGKL